MVAAEVEVGAVAVVEIGSPAAVVGLGAVAPLGMKSCMVGAEDTLTGSARIGQRMSGRSPARLPVAPVVAVIAAGAVAPVHLVLCRSSSSSFVAGAV